jgi:lysophospholipase L1-like esterase
VSPSGASRSLPGWLGAVVLVVWSLTLPFACGEIALRAASRAGVLFFDTEMWRYAREVKRPSVRPGVVLEHRPDAEATVMGVRVRTDAHGFRRADLALEALRTGRERLVAVVGDSCALGWGVPEGATMSEDLERRLNAARPEAGHRFTVVNAGVGNSNTAMEYARYVQDVRPLRPAWVILGYFINDAEPDPRTSEPPLVEHSVLLAVLSTRIPFLASPLARDYNSYYESLYAPGSAGLQRLLESLQAFGSDLRDDGVPATLLLIPEMHQPRGFGSFAPIYRRVAKLGAESGFEVVDPSDDFPPGSGQALWVTPGDSHPNAEAHAILAAALARSPIAERLIH